MPMPDIDDDETVLGAPPVERPRVLCNVCHKVLSENECLARQATHHNVHGITCGDSSICGARVSNSFGRRDAVRRGKGEVREQVFKLLTDDGGEVAIKDVARRLKMSFENARDHLDRLWRAQRVQYKKRGRCKVFFV